ncbi:hypothetical protein MMC17_004756 [Xylographa soralifera]|nr:hypothetical protein [Xylographa soralifera]
MAPDRGSRADSQTTGYHSISSKDDNQEVSEEPDLSGDEDSVAVEEAEARDEAREFLAERADEGQNFTVRGVLVGLAIGVIICFSNMYFGLQTGWVSGMAMPAALIGFAFFKTVARHINYPFTPVENVLVQTVAGALGTMPLGCGFVGVLPALNYLLKPEENGPLVLGTGKLMIWAVGICFFGVFIAVPLRREVLIREKLKFPSGTATALMIGVLHGNEKGAKKQENPMETFRRRSQDMRRSRSMDEQRGHTADGPDTAPESGTEADRRSDWKAQIKLLIIAFGVSAVYTLASYFVPPLHDIPILGLPLAHTWLWTLNPSPAYIGQGIIMGPATTLHMLLGAVVGWGILSPLAKNQGWAPGPVEDWETGSKGWIVWVSLAIMLADSIVSLGWLILRPAIQFGPHYIREARERIKSGNYRSLLGLSATPSKGAYTPLSATISASRTPDQKPTSLSEPDAPPEHLVSSRVVYLGLLVSIALCVGATHIVFASLIPLYATLLAILLALILSLMGVRALGETDLNPVSGISKLTQLAFALLIPSSNPNAIIINLLAGAISESGALQAGDMMQDLKTGHLLGAAPKAQFYGQLIGSFVGAIVSAAVYKLYTSVYAIPGGMFQVPTAYVWIFTARLVTGKGLPDMAWQWALGGGCIFAVLTAFRIVGQGKTWQAYLPGGIAVAVGMYNVPSFTLARTCGGLVSWWWSRRGGEEGTVIVLASGLILGEGVVSIVNLGLASFRVPHL